MHVCISIAQPGEAPSVKVARFYSDALPTLSQLFSYTIPGPADGTPEVVGDIGELTKQDLKRVSDFIASNRDVLVRYWYLLYGWQIYRKPIHRVAGGYWQAQVNDQRD